MSDITEARLAAVEQRLANIERELSRATARRMPPLVEESIPSPSITAPSSSPATPPNNWLGMVAIACFILAGGFIIKLSIGSGWLTPPKQAGLAILLGLSLIASGFVLMRSDRAYAALLPSGGIVVFYITAFASNRFYHLISFEAALICTGLISAICVWLYTKIRHDIYAIIAAAGAYLSPILLHLGEADDFSLYYFLLCSCAFATISIWVESRLLAIISSYLAILVSAATGLMGASQLVTAIVLALHFIVFCCSTYSYSRYHNTILSKTEAWAFLPVLLLFYATEYTFVERLAPALAPWLSLGFAALLGGLYLSARRYFPDNEASRSLVMAFATLVCFHSVYLELLPADFKPWLLVIMLWAIAARPALASGARQNAYLIPLIALTIIAAIEYLSILFDLFSSPQESEILVALVVAASVWLAISRTGTALTSNNPFGHPLLAATHLLAMAGLYQFTQNSGSLAVSASWLLYAVAVMAFAFRHKDELMAKSALLVLAFAAGKALLYDAANAPTTIRIFCLLLTGTVLYGCGFFMRKIANWDARDGSSSVPSAD